MAAGRHRASDRSRSSPRPGGAADEIDWHAVEGGSGLDLRPMIVVDKKRAAASRCTSNMMDVTWETPSGGAGAARRIDQSVPAGGLPQLDSIPLFLKVAR